MIINSAGLQVTTFQEDTRVDIYRSAYNTLRFIKANLSCHELWFYFESHFSENLDLYTLQSFKNVKGEQGGCLGSPPSGCSTQVFYPL